MSDKKGMFEPLRVRLRRLQFSVGLGFVALMLGSMLSGSLAMRLHQRLGTLGAQPVRLLVGVVLEQLWVLLVLPGLCYAVARVLEVRPRSLALGGALSGQTFVFMMQYIREGSLLSQGQWRVDVLRAVAFSVGVYLSWRAVVQGRAAATSQADQVKAQAESRKSEYDEFLRNAEREGERLAQREAERASATAEATGTAGATEGQGASMAPVASESAPAAAEGAAQGAEVPAATSKG